MFFGPIEYCDFGFDSFFADRNQSLLLVEGKGANPFAVPTPQIIYTVIKSMRERLLLGLVLLLSNELDSISTNVGNGVRIYCLDFRSIVTERGPFSFFFCVCVVSLLTAFGPMVLKE